VRLSSNAALSINAYSLQVNMEDDVVAIELPEHNIRNQFDPNTIIVHMPKEKEQPFLPPPWATPVDCALPRHSH